VITTYNLGMTCQSLTLADGSTVLVNVKPGKTLLPEDIAALTEFYNLLHKAAEGDLDAVPEYVEGYTIGKRSKAALP